MKDVEGCGLPETHRERQLRQNPLVCANDVHADESFPISFIQERHAEGAVCLAWKLREFKVSSLFSVKILKSRIFHFIFSTIASALTLHLMIRGMTGRHADAQESKLSKNDILNATDTLYFSHIDMAECKHHRYASSHNQKRI